MSNREVMQQALEALTCCEAMDRNAEQQKTQAITALRTALEQPEQGPVRMPCVGKDPRCPCQDGDACHYKDCDGGTKARPVSPAQRQWQGLTEEDWVKIEDMPDAFDQGVAWAQARLKERNNGH
tara:strand:+ start:342 stop:713 length:372 start_codon:yes stop_codon:yes gene_type:complete